MKPLLVVKNITREGPGLLEEAAAGRGIEMHVIDLSLGESFPRPGGYSGVILLGGPDSARDRTEKMSSELARVSECLEREIPFLGICLGLQVMVRAGGGDIVTSPVRETGFRGPDGNFFTLVLTPEGMKDPLLRDLPSPFRVFQLHGEAVRPGPGMTVLAEGAFCREQIVRAGPCAWGIQCHFEMTEAMLELWLREDEDLRRLDSEAVRQDFVALRDEYTKTGLKLFSHFLDCIAAAAGMPEGRQP